jgi:RNA polymerase sigma-70 factor (ECF subfamily)
LAWEVLLGYASKNSFGSGLDCLARVTPTQPDILAIASNLALGALTVIDRTNDEWLEQLANQGPASNEAIADLREILQRGLQKGLNSRAHVDASFIEDMTQDSVVKVLNSLDKFRGESKLTTWAISIAIRVAFSELRRARWRDVSFDDLAESARDPAAAIAPTDSAPEKEEMIAVMRHVIENDLTERQRYVLIGELNGIPQVELCDRLKLSPNALYKLFFDARQRLKRELLAKGIQESDVRQLFGITSKK